MTMLRAELIEAREYLEKTRRAAAAPDKGGPPPRDLKFEMLARVATWPCTTAIHLSTRHTA